MNFNAKIKRDLQENRKAWVDMFYILRKELYGIFTDKGTLIIFFIATLIYPLVCGYVYNRELLRDAPIAVVDMSHSSMSRKYIRMLDATPEVQVAYECTSMEEAKQLQKFGKAHGIIYIPKDFYTNICTGRQTTVSVYADVTSFFWYRGINLANSYVSRTMGYTIEATNLIAHGMGYDDAMRSIRPFIPQEQLLYQLGGYPSFMLPIILIILLQQTILIGIGILAGKTTERNRSHNITPNNIHYRGVFRIIFGRLLAVFITYAPIVVYVLIIIPKYFNIPQLMGSPFDVLIFVIPFLLASILLGMTCSVFFHHRENAIPFFIFMSIPILLMSGLSWPREVMPAFWRYFSYIFPSTSAANGFIRINSMGANLLQVSSEHFFLWMQVGFYFITTFVVYYWKLNKGKREKKLAERKALRARNRALRLEKLHNTAE